MSAVEKLNDCLSGSPYLFDHDPKGAARAEFLLEECSRIEERHQRVAEAFAEQSVEIQERIDQMTNASVVYESNALESAGLPLYETQRAILDAPHGVNELGQYIAEQAVHADPHLIEVLGLQQATLFARQLARDYATSAIPIREVDVRSLHASTVPAERHAGSYREVEVGIAGSTHVPPSVVDVTRQMQELVAWLNTTEAPPPLAAAAVHSWLTIIHPFEDGNGRVARLLANIVLLRAAWPHLIVRSSDRLQYLDALSSSDEAGNLLPLFDLFVKSIKRTLKQLERPDLARRLFDADLRANPDLRFELWSGQLDLFLNELRTHLRPTGFDLHRLHVPSASTLLMLEERDPSANTWLAKLKHGDGRDLLLWLGYMTSDLIDAWDVHRPAPSIFISERDLAPDAIHPYRNPITHGSPLRIAELALVPGVGTKQALIRRGYLTVSDHTVPEAAQILAEAISVYSPRLR